MCLKLWQAALPVMTGAVRTHGSYEHNVRDIQQKTKKQDWLSHRSKKSVCFARRESKRCSMTRTSGGNCLPAEQPRALEAPSSLEGRARMQNDFDWWFRERRSSGESARSDKPEESPALCPAEQISVVRAIRICSGINTVAEYSAWLSQDLGALLHHRGWVCGLGSLRPDGYTAAHWLVSSGPHGQSAYAHSTSKSFATPKTVASPLLTGWLEHRRPQVHVRADDGGSAAAADDLFALRPLNNAILHCQLDPENKWTSVFGFANMDSLIHGNEGSRFRHCLLLDLLVPHLHATLCRIIAPATLDHSRALNRSIKLTIRELQILRHIKLGRTNGEIAESLNKSVFTVNNQVVKVLEKLSAKNRTHAVFVAKDMGLLDS
jgi:DNA-binding CsgD family transcriptional regulator